MNIDDIVVCAHVIVKGLSVCFQYLPSLSMYVLRKLISRPAVDDWSPLSKFYYADEALNAIANELDSFDGRRDPERCNQLVNKMRQAQDRVLHIIGKLLLLIFTNIH
jgi:hypothetical protein